MLGKTERWRFQRYLTISTFRHLLRLNCHTRETLMQAWVAPLRFFSYGVVALMLVAIAYAAFISIKYWSGIGV